MSLILEIFCVSKKKRPRVELVRVLIFFMVMKGKLKHK